MKKKSSEATFIGTKLMCLSCRGPFCRIMRDPHSSKCLFSDRLRTGMCRLQNRYFSVLKNSMGRCPVNENVWIHAKTKWVTVKKLVFKWSSVSLCLLFSRLMRVVLKLGSTAANNVNIVLHHLRVWSWFLFNVLVTFF